MSSPVADSPAQAVEVLRNVLLVAGLAEVVAWSAALRYAGVLPTWPAAAAFAAASFTTLGNSPVTVPPGWHMLGPIIAISGLFTFGWSGSVLVDVVRRLGHMRDLSRVARRRRPVPVPARPTT